jgi:hypothetical protein
MQGPQINLPVHLDFTQFNQKIKSSPLEQQNVKVYQPQDPSRANSEPNLKITNQNQFITTQTESEDMEVQMERKRRREEEKRIDRDVNESKQYFLSAGPGSQDCRDQ